MNEPKPEPNLTPALFTDLEITFLKRTVRDADGSRAQQYFEAGLERAQQKIDAKKRAK